MEPRPSNSVRTPVKTHEITPHRDQRRVRLLKIQQPMDQRIQKIRHQVSLHLCTRTSQEAIEKALTWIISGRPARGLNKIFKASLSIALQHTEATNDIDFPRSVTLSSIITMLKDIPILDVDGQEDYVCIVLKSSRLRTRGRYCFPPNNIPRLVCQRTRRD